MRNPTLSFSLLVVLLGVGCAIDEPVEGTDATDATAVSVLAGDLGPSNPGDASFVFCPQPVAGRACRWSWAVSLASNGPGTLTYDTVSCWNACEMSWHVPWDGSSGTVAWPVRSSGTVSAGTGFVYTLTCALVINGCAALWNTKSVVVQ